MVSFRYLVVTIVSIFLALGLGVLAGTTVLDQSLVKNLKDRTKLAEHDRDSAKRELATTSRFLSELVPRVVEGRLTHREIVLVTDANADGGAVATARDFLTNAGASVVGQLAVSSRIAADDPDGSGLSDLTGTSGSGSSVAQAAARELADRLEAGPPASNPTAPASGNQDILKELLDGGFLLPQGAPDITEIGGAEQSVVVVAGGDGEPAAPFTDFVLPLVEQLLRDGVPVAAAQPAAAQRGFVGLLHDDAAIGGNEDMVTVDNLSPDQPFGGVALVFALKDLLETGHGGEYGDDAPTLVPQLP